MKCYILKITLLWVICLTCIVGKGQKKLLILGSSTSACYGPATPANCYVNKLLNYYNAGSPAISIDNRAVSGFNVYKSMPVNFRPPAGRDSAVGYYNITDGLAANPDLVLINYPTNGYDIFSVTEVMNCFRVIRDAANKAGKPCYITTTQPRTGFDAAGREKLRILKDSILFQFGPFAIDFWTDIADPSTLAIATPYQSSDLVHLNDAGHALLFQRVVDKNIFTGAPVADAGSDISVSLPNFGFLNGTKSMAAVGNTLTKFSWSKKSGPDQYYLTSPYEIGSFLKYIVAGTYTFRLTVTDDKGLSSFDDMVVTVTNGQTPPAQPPVSAAGADQTITLPTSTVVLDGTKSGAPGSAIAKYSWTYVSGPSAYSIVTPLAATTSINGLIQGNYTFRLTITNSAGATASDDVVVTVNGITPPAQPPVSVAGADQSITLPASSVVLDGTNSGAPGSTITKYSWTYVSGPSTYSIITPLAATTTINGLIQGIYTFRLTITNSAGTTASDDVIIQVNAPVVIPPTGGAPVANAGDDFSFLCSSFGFLNGSKSFAAPGYTITKYQWTELSGPLQYYLLTPNDQGSFIKYAVAGKYTFRLTITDSKGATAFDDINVTATDATPPTIQAPIAQAGPDINLMLPASSVTVDGSKSSAPGSSISKYYWNMVSGPSACNILNSAAMTTSINSLAKGVYTFRLTVTNASGLNASDDIVVTVSPAVIPQTGVTPVANAGDDISMLSTSFGFLNGTKSFAAAGSTLTKFLWSRISGPSSYYLVSPTEIGTFLKYTLPGIYVFRLSVTDDKGLTAFDDVTVNVTDGNPISTQPATPAGPLVNAGPDLPVLLPNNAFLDGGKTTPAPGTTLINYSWSKTSGPAQFNIVSPTASSTFVNSLAPGTYTFRLTVSDNKGLSNYDDVVVTVNAGTIGKRNRNAMTGQLSGDLYPADEASFLVYPMLVNQTIQLKWNDSYKGAASLQIYDVRGEIIKKLDINKNQQLFSTSINLDHLQQGIYIMQMKMKDGQTISRRFIKK